MTAERLFKFLGEDGQPHYGGSGTWPLPSEDAPGAWRTVTGPLVPCANGLHLCRVADLPVWPAPTLYEAEYRGERIDTEDKIVVREARLIRHMETWNERTMRLWACDCAERVLFIYERDTGDRRPREAIAVARRFANGEATSDELAAAREAAREAAWAAGREAAWAAGREAAWAAGRAAARAAAWAAGREAAREAARAAAWAAAWEAERQWQLDRLMSYLDGRLLSETSAYEE